MSAFVVEDQIINRVVTFLADLRDGEHIRRVIADETGFHIEQRNDRERLGAAMFALNCSAVEQRYGEGEAKEFRDLNYAYQIELTNAIQAFKALECWSYQCCEGDVPETSLLYATMGRVGDLLARHIVQGLSMYDKAKW